MSKTEKINMLREQFQTAVAEAERQPDGAILHQYRSRAAFDSQEGAAMYLWQCGEAVRESDGTIRRCRNA